MKIKGFIVNDKKYIYQKTFVMLIIYIIGIILGAIYCTLIASQSDDSLYSYLSNFFTHIKEDLPYIKTLKSSLFKNIRLFLIIYILSHFRLGSLFVMSTVGIKGFVSGFASGVFIKYYSAKGILVILSSFFANFLFIPAFLVFSAASVIMAADRKNADKTAKRNYILLAICCLTTFCISSVFDSFFTTTFMKLMSPLFT